MWFINQKMITPADTNNSTIDFYLKKSITFMRLDSMNKNIILAFMVMSIIDAIILIVILLAYVDDIIPGVVASTFFLLVFVVTAFVSAALLDLLEPIFKTLGEIFSGLGGFLGR